jgi:ABC-2 type transport system ATP-binding protein
MADVIRMENLTKNYGKRRGVSEVSLAIPAGEVFGFLGPNGAGKTTTIRVLLGFLRPSSGHASLFGADVTRQPATLHRRIGYLPGELSLYERMTGRDMLRYFMNLRGGGDLQYAETIAKRLDLDLTRPARTLSKGNKQKIGLVQAFMHRPDLLILDEPTAGLDPLMQQEFYRLLEEARAAGQTVFLSSHVLSEVDRVADRVGIIREGRLVVVEAVQALKNKTLRRLDVQLDAPVPDGALAGVHGVREVVAEDHRLRCTVEGSMDGLIKALAQYPVLSLTSHEPDLEEIFLAY